MSTHCIREKHQSEEILGLRSTIVLPFNLERPICWDDTRVISVFCTSQLLFKRLYEICPSRKPSL